MKYKSLKYVPNTERSLSAEAKEVRSKAIFTSILFVVAALLLLTLLLPLKGAENLYKNVLRFHVIANSDSDDDQRVKLEVRDAILKYAAERLPEMSSSAEAFLLIERELPALEATGDKVLRQNGFDKTCEASLSREYYPLRTYDGFALPSGEYMSLKIVIGEGAGKNWWCVLYPPLCLNTASNPGTLLKEIGVSRETAAMLVSEGEGYEVRFWLIDFAGRIFGRKKK